MSGTKSGPVVVGVDGSPSSGAATRWAADEAARTHTTLRLVHAYLPVTPSAGMGMADSVDVELVDLVADDAARLVDEVRTAVAADHPDLPIEAITAVGSASNVLREQADQASLVVLGSRGRGGFLGLMLGSVSRQIAAHSACPVVVVRGDGSTAARRVVVGVDGSAPSRAALGFGFAAASRRGWSLLALHAWEIPAYDPAVATLPPATLDAAALADEELRLTAEVLAGWREQFPDVEVEQRLVQSSAAGAIVDASADAGLVVVGSRGRGGFLGLVLGSVSHSVLHHAKCPVAVVRGAD
ncbi:MAG: universal stress protein [Actinomycetota bacterium]|nr:MAG: universal stress protein [Actinomycetota bacterium]